MIWFSHSISCESPRLPKPLFLTYNIRIIYVGDLPRLKTYKYFKGLEARGNAGIVLLMKLGIEKSHNEDRIYDEISTRASATNTTKLTRNLYSESIDCLEI